MRPLALWRYELGRAGWTALLTPPVTAGLVLVLAILQAGSGDDVATARTLQGVLEVGVPLAVGMGAASLVGRDPVAELALTVFRDYRTTLLRRLTITFAWAGVIAVGTTVGLTVSGWWYRWPSAPEPLLGQLTWLAPAMWLGGLGFLLAAVLRNPAAAGGLVAGVWIVELVTANAMQGSGWARLVHLFATTRGHSPGWLANRLVLLGFGAVLLVAGWAVLARSERLITGEGA